ncbi:hypothetical protein [Neobacillus sp. NPDC093127]|uniref:hypothetical protein n=1 Tax=Neobacillus sp. NPDC093127 TaxID=3364296 RepID=UPI00382D4D69
MPYNTKPKKTDVNYQPINQYFNPTIDDHEAVQGSGGAMNVQLIGRKTAYQRVAVNQAIAANGFSSIVVNLGLGTKAIHLAWKANATIAVTLVACDANGSALLNGPSILGTGATGYINGGLVYGEWGGAPYIGILVQDKSAAANTVNYIDLWTTSA